MTRAGVVVRPEPGAAARPEVVGLLDLGHAQPVDPEAAGDVLAAGGQATCTWWSLMVDLPVLDG